MGKLGCCFFFVTEEWVCIRQCSILKKCPHCPCTGQAQKCVDNDHVDTLMHTITSHFLPCASPGYGTQALASLLSPVVGTVIYTNSGKLTAKRIALFNCVLNCVNMFHDVSTTDSSPLKFRQDLCCKDLISHAILTVILMTVTSFVQAFNKSK